jgi:hypothetical protein
MAISMDLRVLARKLEKSSDDLLVNASIKGPEAFEKVATAIAAASTLLEGVADDMDHNAEFSITAQQLDEIAALATAFDQSGDPILKKQASVLDELLLSIAAPKNAARESRKVTDDEINRLREKRRSSRREEAYEDPRKAHADMNNAKEQAKAVAQQVKRYRPLEAPLQTRYPPDRPGGQMTRITDHVYQDIVTGIVYDFKAGYTTQKGNEVPGTSVENQTRQLGDARNQSTSLFETRQALMGRYASDGDLYHLKKYAMGNEIVVALKAARDFAPELLDKAIDHAQQDGLSTSEIGEVLSDVASADEFNNTIQTLENPSRVQIISVLTDDESAEEYHKAVKLFDAFAAAGWSELIADHMAALKHAGLGIKYLSKLESEFLGAEPYESSTEIVPESLENEISPFSNTEFTPSIKTMISAANRQGLAAVALGAVQELAPHLLKAAVAKAKGEGLTDKQIKSVLITDLNNKFKTASFGEDGEVKVAESLFPQLRALGWNSLVQDHLKVMARLGVSGKAIQKLAYVKTSTLDELKSVLKQAVFGTQPLEFIDEPLEFVEESPQTVRDPQTFDWEEEEEPVTIKQQPKAPVATAPKAKTPKAVPVANWEFVNEPIAAPAAPAAPEEEAPFSLLTEMFGDTPKPPAVKGPVTPLDDPEEWGKVLAAVKSEIAADQSVKDKIQEFRLAGKKEDSYVFVKQLINEKMNAQGFIGAYEKDPSGVDWITVAEKGGVKTPSPTPMITELPKETGPQGQGKRFNWSNYQTLNRLAMSDSEIEELEKRAKEIWARDGGQYSSMMEKFKFTGTEVPAVYSSLPPEIRKQLDVLFLRGEGSTAVRGLLNTIVENYIQEHAEQFLQERISELSGKADELFEESSKLEASGKSRQAQTKLEMAAKIKEQLDNPEELLKSTIKTKKEQFMLTEKDLMAARKGLRSNDKAKAAEIKREALTELNKQSINQALQEKKLPPMFDNVNVISLARFAEKLQEIGKIDAVVKEDAKRARTLGGKKPSLLIHEIPKNKVTGQPLATLWDDPEFYLETIKEVSEDHPLPDVPRKTEDKKVKEQKLKDRKAVEEIWNNIFEDRGLVGPFRKLFGTGPDWEGTIASTLNLRPDKVDFLRFEDLVPNTVINGKQLKTILSNPEEYANHYLEGKAKFGPEFQWKLEPILEMNQIHGGTPKINAPAKLISFVKSRMDKGQDLDNLKVELMAKGVPAELTENVWNEIKGSGDVIRKRLFGGLAGGAQDVLKGKKTPQEVIDDLLNNPRNGIMTKFPDAYIPSGVMQALLKQLIAKEQHNNKVKADWNKWSSDQGFWPPYSRIMGRSTTADLLKGGSGYRNPDPDAVGGTPLAELNLD